MKQYVGIPPPLKQSYWQSTSLILLLLQFCSVMLVILGIVLFAYADGFERINNVIGIILSVGSAIGAALYKV